MSSSASDLSYPGKTYTEALGSEFVVHKNDGSLVTWTGISMYKNSFLEVEPKIRGNVNQVFSNWGAWAVLRTDGSVITWGGNGVGGDSSGAKTSLAKDVVDIFSTKNAFAALKKDGSVVAWGGNGNLNWDLSPLLDKDVKKIISSGDSFIALKNDNTAIHFGTDLYANGSVKIDIVGENVKEIIPSSSAFALHHFDNSISLYVSTNDNGLRDLYKNSFDLYKEDLSSGVEKVYPGYNAFVAIKSNGEVYNWGQVGSYDLYENTEGLTDGNIKHIYGQSGSFVALKNDGSVITWGNIVLKKNASYNQSKSFYSGHIVRQPLDLKNVISIVGTGDPDTGGAGSWAALTKDGQVVTWGLKAVGGDSSIYRSSLNNTDVSSKLASGVVEIVSNQRAFAALKEDGSVVTWGDAEYGGDSGSVSNSLTSGVKAIKGSSYAFAVIKEDGSVVSWPATALRGGNIANATGDISSGVVDFVTPYTDKWEVSEPQKSENQMNDVGEIDTKNVDQQEIDDNLGVNNSSLIINSDIINKITRTISSTTQSYLGISSSYKFFNLGDDRFAIKTDSGYDEITGVKNIQFTDKTLNLESDIEATFDQVTGLNTDSGEMFRLYNAAFARFPDADGLKYWIDQFSSGRNSRRVVAQSFLGSAEFTEKYGSNVSDETYVNNLYKNVLGRDADAEGLNYWVGNLRSGIETRYEALLGFAESAENKVLFTEMTGFG